MAITWNIESLKKNIFFLKEVVETRRPSLVMLSEPQTHQADVAPIMDYLAGDFCYYLNSEDLHHQELPLVSNHAVGGTMCLWSRSLDPYVTVHPTPTSAFTTIILAIPNYMISIHITIYLPTHGKDVEFLADMAELRICLADLCHQFPDAAIYIRGDGNVNLKNRKRVILLENLMPTLASSRSLLDTRPTTIFWVKVLLIAALTSFFTLLPFSLKLLLKSFVNWRILRSCLIMT